MSEKTPVSCAECPSRSLLSRIAARNGIIGAYEGCPGPSVVSHVTLTVTSSTGSPDVGRSTLIQAKENDRELICHEDEISVREGETMGKIYTNVRGQRWIRNISGNPDDAKLYLALGSLDEDPSNPDVQLIEYI